MASESAIGETLDLTFRNLFAILNNPGVDILFYWFIGAGMVEEPGLRGYALAESQVWWSPLLASLLVGVVWARWHAPALIDQDAVTVVFFNVYAIALSFLFTWFFDRANQAIWAVALLHATINAGDAAFEVFLPGLEGTYWQLPALLAFIIASVAVGIVLWRKQHHADTGIKQSFE